MTEQSQPATGRIGTVAEEAARLIEDVVTMARSSLSRSEDPSPYAGRPAQQTASPDPRPAEDPAAAGAPSAGRCSSCGGECDGGLPVACRLCPLCQGIALLRSVRPETVDRLADLASAVAESLRDLAARSRASGPTPSTGGGPSGSPSSRGRATQDIPVEDEGKG